MTFSKTTTNSGCPSSHPRAYLDGRSCCAGDREADRPSAGDDPPCDGGPLQLDSRCCQDDDYLACPVKEEEGSCRDFEEDAEDEEEEEEEEDNEVRSTKIITAVFFFFLNALLGLVWPRCSPA